MARTPQIARLTGRGTTDEVRSHPLMTAPARSRAARPAPRRRSRRCHSDRRRATMSGRREQVSGEAGAGLVSADRGGAGSAGARRQREAQAGG